MIEIPQPSIAFNAADAPGTKYKMWETWDVPGHATVDQIVERAVVLATYSGNRVKCLVINCHGGYSNKRADGSEKAISTGGFGFCIGEGITLKNVNKFSRLNGLVDCIIIVACGAAYISNKGGHGDGDLLCKELAKAAIAPVIAPKTMQIERFIKMPDNHIDNFEGLVVRYSKSGGLEDSSLLGRKLIREVVS
jgi:hypothetical protein